MAAIGGFEKNVGGVIQSVFIDRRKNKRLRAFGAEFSGVLHDGRNFPDLPGDPIVSGDVGASRAINNIWIHGIRNGISVLDGADRMPIAKSNFAIVASAGNADGAAILLSATHAIRESVIGNDVINLRGGLVIPGTPGASPICTDQRALIADQQNNFRMNGTDPDILVVIAAGRAANSRPGFSGVSGAPGDGAGHIKNV